MLYGVCIYVRPSAWYNSAHTRRVFIIFDVLLFLEILSRITGTWFEDLHIFMILSRPFFLRIRVASDQICRENQNKSFTCNNCFFENRAICAIMQKSMVQPERPQMTIRCMCIACWIRKTTNTHSEYVILLLAAAVVTRRRLNVTLYVHCLSSYLTKSCSYFPHKVNWLIFLTEKESVHCAVRNE